MPPAPIRKKAKERGHAMLNTAAGRYAGDEHHIYAVANGFCAAVAVGYEKRGDFQDCDAEFKVAIKPGQRRVLQETPHGRRLDLIETAKAHFCTKVEHPFRMIKYQFVFRKVFYLGIGMNDLKPKFLLALANL
jgi:transposase, IS5 family